MANAEVVGDWSQIGVSQTATFVDTPAPLVSGQPEVREYRAQGMVSNSRVGDLGLKSGMVQLGSQ